MLQNLAHEVLVDLVRCDKAIHGRRVVQRIDGCLDRGIAGRGCKAGCLEQVLAIDNHLCPAVDRNSGGHAVKLGHGDGTRGESVLLQRIHDVGIGFHIENARLCPRQDILQRVVDHIRKITGGIGCGGAFAEVLLFDRDNLDSMAGGLVEIVRHRLLLGKTLRLVLGCPEPDRVSIRHTCDHGGDHHGRSRYK